MREIHLSDPNLHDHVSKVLESAFPVFIMELRGVYGLCAPHSKQGVNALNHAKARKPGKFYGSLAGNLDTLLAITKPNSIVHHPKALSILDGCFIRFKTNAPALPETVSDGTHQVLIERPSLRAIAQIMESYATPLSEGVVHNPFPLCTSVNMSGASAGSITTTPEALSFAVERNIPLFVHTGSLGTEKGSYPIIEELTNGELRLARNGPQGEQVLQKLQQLR
jgi:tRNA A37 threonylcarbamoyladenosine synthetase subunit TsaC/SUA5/YrdC